jgi:hypothetical protein
MEPVMSLPARRPETEVSAKATRRKFTGEYKSRIVREAAACTKPGELGALLRHLTQWASSRRRGFSRTLPRSSCQALAACPPGACRSLYYLSKKK